MAVAPNGLSAAATGVPNVLGVAGADANVISTQTGAANAYGQPLIDISVLTDYVPVYSGGERTVDTVRDFVVGAGLEVP